MRAGVILYNLKTKQLLLIHRWKNGKEYFVIPGGGINLNETVLQAAQREIREELGWTLSEKVLKPAFPFQNTDKLEVYFFTAISAIQGEELLRSHHYNRYQPEWIMIDKLDQLNLQPVTLKNLLLEFLIQEGLKKEGNYSKI